MIANCFERLLCELDFATAAAHSVLNHHVDGMDYLCLHRSDALTVKLYFIDPARMHMQAPNTYLVTPHTHRYSFESTVLAGTLAHVRFREVAGDAFDRFDYAPEDRSRIDIGRVSLNTHFESHSAGSGYWCNTDDIHTLIVPSAPVLLGLIQLGDRAKRSTVYVRRGEDMRYPESRVPTKEQAHALRDKALEMMETA
jgi:hypothetical protein